jgi:hypothetical protein
MGIFSSDSPNEKPYELRYSEDGELYVQRGAFSSRRSFNLAEAILIANAEASATGILLVTDPETRIVLWAGQPVTR